MQASEAERYVRIEAPFSLSDDTFGRIPNKEIVTRFHLPEEEIAYVVLNGPLSKLHLM